MINIFNFWQIHFIGFLISVVLFFQFYKLAVKDAKNDGSATILLQTIAGVSVLIFIPFFPIKFPTDEKFYVFLLFASIFYALNDRLQVTARKHLEVSVFSIINMLKTVFLVLFGLLFFKEDFVLMKIVGAVFILFGNGLLFYKKGSLKVNKYAMLSVLATLVFAIAMSIDIGISSGFNLPIYISLTLLIPAIILFIFERQSFFKIMQEYNTKRKKYFYITGLFWGLTILFTLKAYQLGEVTTLAPIFASSVIANVVVAYFFHKEKDNIIKKIVASLIVLIGVYLAVMS
jgi:drug/metabolite transporter (DMT)-like permease